MALLGARKLANEIHSYWSDHGKGRPLTVLIPGGTCAMALLVNVALYEILRQPFKGNTATQQSNGDNTTQKMDVRVVVIPCVGDQKYAIRQMVSLFRSIWGDISAMEDRIPAVLPPVPAAPRYVGQSTTAASAGYFQFGEPNADILSTFHEMQESGIPLDLIYGAPAWAILLRHLRTQSRQTKDSTQSEMFDLLLGRELMYVHSGGLEGVNSQLMRYKYKGLVDEVQLPGRP